ncbi:MAG TPA: ABC transporter permease [Candidatus Acidoferrales bacterium]|nr:ABC transporter permease [Candidatus Acidoferrales bacterium]
MGSLLQDLRFALRMLRKSPGFTAVAVLTLALGIGANTAIFTMVNGLMLRTLPVRDPGQLVELLHHGPGEPEPGFNGFPWFAYQIIRDGNHAFSELIVAGMNFFTVHGDKLPPQTVFGGAVGGNFFQALGVRPAAGRLIGPEDVHTGDHAPVAVISWSFWKSRFGLDPGIIGKKIVINDDPPLAVIGVAQRGFYGLSDEAQQDIWWAASLGPGGGPFGLLARLKPGVALEQARAEMAVVFERAVNAPDAGPFVKGMQLRIEPAGDGVSTPLSQMVLTPLTVLMAIVAVLLLLACANLAGLLLARGASRQHEMAVRVCLGAGRGRLLRQTLTESLLLSLVGGAIGIFLAYFADLALARVFASGRFIAAAPLHFGALTNPDAHVLLFTLVIALLAGLLCGAAPALSASNTTPASALQQASRIGETKSRRLFGKGLVASQVALSLVLVSSAGLFVGYLAHLRNLNLGFEPNHLLLVSLDTAQSGYNAAQFARLSQSLVMRLDAIPGVSSATFSGLSPMEGPHVGAFLLTEEHPEKQAQAFINYVGPDYFATYGTPFLAGRDFSALDQPGSPVAIINEAAARDCFGNENPIGRHITLNHISLWNTKDEKTYEVVGLVRDAKYNDLQQPAPPTVYPDLLQQAFIGSELAIRTRIDPDGVVSAVRQTEAAWLNRVPIARIITMNAQIDSTIVPERLIAALSAGFGALGALLAAIGLCGLLAYTVARRTHEIGVRMALGATGTEVMRMVLRDALWMVCVGFAIGAPLAFGVERAAASLISGLPVAAPLPIVVAAAIMIAVGLIAAYVPARRAMRVDPMVALRHE